MRLPPCPRVVAVSDEARLGREDALERIEALARAGAPAILLRGGSLDARRLLELARAARELCRELGAELWVGERVDVAAAAGADGVQLPASGLSIAAVRAVLGDGVRVGRSVHDPEAAARAASDGADHVILGAVHATASHPEAVPGGVERIAAARTAIEAAGQPIPILAIGGMTIGRAAEAAAAGAWGVAAISALWDTEDPAAAVRGFLAAFGGEAGV